jgi:DNA-binding transcriptional regulator YdaS (Cro superfamily)
MDSLVTNAPPTAANAANVASALIASPAGYSAIRAACEAVGGQVVLARALRVTPQAVILWVAGGRVPAQRVLAVEQASGVPRHALRPDLYPQPAAPAAHLPQPPQQPHPAAPAAPIAPAARAVPTPTFNTPNIRS